MRRTTADSRGPRDFVEVETTVLSGATKSTNLNRAGPAGVNYSSPQQQQQQNSGAPITAKALFIGINYYGTQYQLNGCVFDAYNVQTFLKQYMSFPPSTASNQSSQQQVFDSFIMTDEESAKGTMRYPTARNIRTAMQWLVANSDANTRLFLHYSGHGGFRKNYGISYWNDILIISK